MSEKVDVVIVGAGAAGSVFAAKLAEAGKKVVVLEGGPDWQLSDLVSSEIWGRRLKPGGPPVVFEGAHRVGYGYNAGWGVGGAALHYFANFPRLLPSDFKIRSEHGRALDWPISYDDLAPYYDRISVEIGVCGDAKAEERWRPPGKPYPMPPMKTFRHAEVWRDAFDALGIKMIPTSAAINTIDYGGRPACIYHAWCHAGCPIGALGNPLVTYLQTARDKGAEVRALSYVTRLLTNPAGDRITAVEYYDRNKQRQTVEASVVVLAAFAVQNPRILLNSATDKHPTGLANTSGLLGKYIMTHMGSSVWAMFDEDLENHMGVIGYPLMSYDRYGKTARKDSFGSLLWTAGTAFKPNDILGLANARGELDAFMKRARRGLTKIQAFGEELPNADNRVELADDKDEFGFPLAKLTHTYDKDAIATWTAGVEEGLEIAKRTKAKESWPARGAIPTIHTCGGTIMGTAAGNSVVNSYGQAHELPNLYIAGPGIMPTEGAVNPTYTINALSLRGVEHLIGNWAAVAR